MVGDSPANEHQQHGVAWWLNELNAPAHTWLSALALHRDGHRQTLWTSADNTTQFAADIENHAGDVWLGCCTRRQRLDGGRRGGDNDCATMPGLWIDIDIQGAGHATDRLPADEQAAHQLLTRFPAPPTWILHTGGGLQAWWLFHHHHNVSPQLLTGWAHTWSAHAHDQQVHLDNVFDAARIMRVPGTSNYKTGAPRPIRIIGGTGQRHHPDDLQQHFRELPAAPIVPIRHAPTDATMPGHVFNQLANAAHILSQAGWTHTRTDRNGDQHWAYPQASGDHSATVYAEDGHTTIWSETAAANIGLQTRRPYDPFGLYAWLQHGGDFRAASDELQARGVGTKTAPTIDTIIATPPKTQTPAPSAWLPYKPLRTPPNPLPAWPTHILPDWVRDHVNQVSASVRTPVDLAAQLALGCVTTLCMSRVRIRVSKRHDEPATLYLLAVMPPSSGKSPVERLIAGPLQDLERRVVDETAGDQRIARDLHQKAQDEYKRQSAKADITPAELRDLWADIQNNPLPVDSRWLTRDTTPEALQTILAATGGRAAIVSSEGNVLEHASGLYATKPNLEVYLAGWGADPIRVDRKNSEPINIPQAHLTIVVCIQPSALHDLYDDSKLTGRGFPQRFMISTPRSLVGTRFIDSDDDQPMTSGAAWANGLDRLHNALHDRNTEVVFDGHARRLWESWHNQLERRRAAGGDLAGPESLTEWVGKLEGSVARVAGILHVIHQRPLETPVGVDMVEAAIELGDYWLTHRLDITNTEIEDPAVVDAEKVLEWAARQDGTDFPQRDIRRGLRRRLDARSKETRTKPPEVLEAALELLVENGLGRLASTIIPEGGGTPTKRWAFRMPSEAAECETVGDGWRRGGTGGSQPGSLEPQGIERLARLAPPQRGDFLSSSSSFSIGPPTHLNPGDMAPTAPTAIHTPVDNPPPPDDDGSII